MSYYNQQQPPVGVPPPQGYPPEGYSKDAYPPPGYPQQGYPPQGYPQQGYPPPQYAPQYGAPPPQQHQQQSSSTGLMQGCCVVELYGCEIDHQKGKVEARGARPLDLNCCIDPSSTFGFNISILVLAERRSKEFGQEMSFWGRSSSIWNIPRVLHINTSRRANSNA
ncbi:hypothetical protein KY289_037540 [Solanum tuberosum]|nr:hypothetical protein KY289_037540 [Solanum tuberosum]